MKKTTKVVWMAVAVITLSFSLFATEPQSARLDFKQGTALYEKKEYEKAFQFFKAEANKGDAEAQFWVGRCYANGEGVVQNYMLAAEWYTKSANQNYFKAQHNLALLYYDGNGVKQDYRKALELFKKAEESHSNPMSEHWIGIMYYYGDGVERNYAQAKEWLVKSNKQGYEASKEFLELIQKKEQPAPKSINWTILEEDRNTVKYQYFGSNLGIQVLYSTGTQSILLIYLLYNDGTITTLGGNAAREIDGRFKTMKELNSFLHRCHNEFFYASDDNELVEIIRKYTPARKTVSFQ